MSFLSWQCLVSAAGGAILLKNIQVLRTNEEYKRLWYENRDLLSELNTKPETNQLKISQIYQWFELPRRVAINVRPSELKGS